MKDGKPQIFSIKFKNTRSCTESQKRLPSTKWSWIVITVQFLKEAQHRRMELSSWEFVVEGSVRVSISQMMQPDA